MEKNATPLFSFSLLFLVAYFETHIVTPHERPGAQRFKQVVVKPAMKNKQVNHESSDSTSPTTFQTTLAITWIILCVSGNGFQVYNIASEYFSYQILTELQVVIPEDLDFPSFTFCFHLTQMLMWKDMSHDEMVTVLQSHPKFKEILSQNGHDLGNKSSPLIKSLPSIMKDTTNRDNLVQMTSHLQSLPVSRIFEVTKSIGKVLVAGLLFTEKLNTTNIPFFPTFLSTKMSPFLKDVNKCFNYEVNPEYESIRYSGVMRQLLVPGLLAMFFVNPRGAKNINEVQFILTPNGKQMRSGFYSYSPISLSTNRQFKMTYNTFESHLLKRPFPTDCLDYKDEEMGTPSSRGDCYESCVKREFLNRSSGRFLHPGVNVYEGKNDDENENAAKITPILDLLSNPLVKEWKSHAEDFCHDRCSKKDCLSILHIPRRMSMMGRTKKPVILVYAPQTPVIRSVSKAGVTLTLFLADAIASLGFWLGVSALGFSRFVRRSGREIIQAYLIDEEELEEQERRRKERMKRRKGMIASAPSQVSMKRIPYRVRHPTMNYNIAWRT